MAEINLELVIGDTKVKLTMDEAEKLHRDLSKLFPPFPPLTMPDLNPKPWEAPKISCYTHTPDIKGHYRRYE